MRPASEEDVARRPGPRPIKAPDWRADAWPIVPRACWKSSTKHRRSLWEKSALKMKNSGQAAEQPKQFKLGHLGTLNQVIVALGKTIRGMADGSC